MDVPWWAAAPFAVLLLCIGLLPLVAGHFWHSNRNKTVVVLLLAGPVAGYLVAHGPAGTTALLHGLGEYASFIALLGALYVIAGGVVLEGELREGPLTNTGLLALGAMLANLVGTTGASMLLVRPFLALNRGRRRQIHLPVFFIFVVGNTGGLLTPLGDPPLLLGYLQGVPFAWTFRLWPQWLVAVATLLPTYLVWDSIHHAREPIAALRMDRAQREPLRLAGAPNGLWLLGVVAAVALLHEPWREMVIVALAGVSLGTTPSRIRRANGFTASPLLEVAVLFFGIFLTMIPALELLRTRGSELGIREPWQFFWASGIVSSFLDNAPTYLTFLALGQGLRLPDEVAGVPHATLAAISTGAVFMGANTYIGNAPNFMVKAVADEARVRMPSFFGYLAYSGLVLLPLFALMTRLFF